jgi:hypothetical protein
MNHKRSPQGSSNDDEGQISAAQINPPAGTPTCSAARGIVAKNTMRSTKQQPPTVENAVASTPKRQVESPSNDKIDAKTTMGVGKRSDDYGPSSPSMAPLEQSEDRPAAPVAANRFDAKTTFGAQKHLENERLDNDDDSRIAPATDRIRANENASVLASAHRPGAFRVDASGAVRAAKPTLEDEDPLQWSEVPPNETADHQVVISGMLASTLAETNGAHSPDPAIPKATEVRLDQLRPLWLRRRSIAYLVFFVLCLAVAVASGVLVSGRNRTSVFDEFMSSSSWSIDTRPIAARDPLSPQAQALRWLERDLQHNSTLEPWRVRQRYALAVFYFSLNGRSWLNNTGWLSVNHECSWYSQEVAAEGPCDANHRLVSLWSSSNNMSGSLPLDLGYLSDVKRIWLSSNIVVGPIPSTISNLIQLQYLDLSANSLSGPLPSRLVRLPLEDVSLYSNKFTGTIPAEFGMLTNLNSVYFDENLLNGTIPTQVGLLGNLTVLGLPSNFLSGPLPTEIGLMKELVGFAVTGNFLNGTIPTEIGLMSKLEGASFSSNSFTGTIPSEM